MHPDDPDRLTTLEAQLQQRDRALASLRETAFAVGSELDLDRLFELIVARARELIGAGTVLLPLLNRACNAYTYRAGAGDHAAEIVGESLPLDFGVCGWVWKHQRPWWRGMLSELSEQEKNLWEKEAGTLLMVPLVGRQHFLGGIACHNKSGGGEFTHNDLQLLEVFAGQAAIAIENAMAMENIEQARQAAEAAQAELNRLNRRLTTVNQELEYLSLYDNLTGLPNRSLFRDRVRKEIEQRGDSSLALLIVDIDRFQEINDTLGHEAGDELLRVAAARFVAALAPADTISRMSGDEFAVLLGDTDAAQALATARRLLATLDQTMLLAGQDVLVTTSIGIALFPRHGQDISALFKHADAAMLAAKREKCGVLVFDEQRDSASPGRFALIRDLRAALDDSEFALHYQPKVDLATNSITGVEALARWRRHNGTIVPPDMFISALEQTGLIQRFTWWALETALCQRHGWLATGLDLNIAVNVPVSVVMDAQFLPQLSDLLARHATPGGITLEITENVFFGDYDQLKEVLSRLRAFSIECSIDDFGTGYSSLSRLRMLPVAELKIDRSFVTDMLTSKDDAAIVKSTIDLAHNLGLRVVAEGVENLPTLQQLYQWRCNCVQGYHISRALPAIELASFLERAPWAVAGMRGKARSMAANGHS